MKEQMEQHWRIKAVAQRLSVSPQTATRMFENDPRVRIHGEQVSTKQKRKHRTIMIPDSVLQEYLRRLRG
jgi:AraC-like DNA-binding protein